MKQQTWILNSNYQASELDKEQYQLFAKSLTSIHASNLMEYEFKIGFELHSSLFNTQVTPSTAPTSLGQLLTYCQQICGKSIEEISHKHNVEMIYSLHENRGWLGNLIEIALGATAGSKPTQDFINLGIELKTLAIATNGKAKSDIFISSLPINKFMLQNWQTSHVLYKLKKILFVPIEYNPDISLAQRRIGKAFLWSPNKEDLAIIKQDWETIMQIITQQDFNALKSNVGQILCVRTKALNTSQAVSIEDTDGFNLNLPPLSFYLRRSFINNIINSNFYEKI
ncbi:MutH/Sau3AI family endonuclease [Psittacicella gerlachiana]|uniref:DNA mismatch repair MutH/Type II restriction enzyme Sau3AI domain-containing protein n=1 Tax=Psittacicella gerlachiana TaxID=2028574 RepID=A0A3A1YCR6_9GAMM|nr:MutH/Sau3AI family endonuclease [Psittacicella gerlachiana]RIY34978.1 hypothetical protein CKF59_04345 [Psittacicella gerlachiana]